MILPYLHHRNFKDPFACLYDAHDVHLVDWNTVSRDQSATSVLQTWQCRWLNKKILFAVLNVFKFIETFRKKVFVGFLYFYFFISEIIQITL